MYIDATKRCVHMVVHVECTVSGVHNSHVFIPQAKITLHYLGYRLEDF